MSRVRTARVLEGVQQEIARHERPGLDGPLVEIHTRVQASRLLMIRLRASGQRFAVARCGIGGEEAVGVEVRAAQLVRLHHVIGAPGAESKRQVVTR